MAGSVAPKPEGHFSAVDWLHFLSSRASLLVARLWQALADLSSGEAGRGSMRAGVVVRYAGAHDLGHVGWAFDLSSDEANAGAVENPGGTERSTPATMGFWQESLADPMPCIRQHSYNDVKVIDLPKGDAVAAYGVVKWIGTQPYDVLGRNCLDDVYDVMRTYGVADLPLPSHDLLPNEWFVQFHGRIAPVATYEWPKSPPSALTRALRRISKRATPRLRPTWRTPGHRDARDFQAQLRAQDSQRA
jgi:hypothetical protein